eukprot:Nk52_evm134s226 gene=Nk52_evmTU134s226
MPKILSVLGIPLRNLKLLLWTFSDQTMGRRSMRNSRDAALGPQEGVRRFIQLGGIEEGAEESNEQNEGCVSSSMGSVGDQKKDLSKIRTVVPKYHSLPKSEYISNRVTNSKYTALTFLPLNLKEQFGRFINQYFLLIACLQLIRTLTPVSPVTTWTPLIVIFLISALKEGLDDYRRHRADDEWNNKKYHVVGAPCRGTQPLKRCGVAVRSLKCKDIQVGDVLYVKENDEIPCDAVLLHTSDAHGACFVQTANIDGETDLKPRFSTKLSQEFPLDRLLAFSPDALHSYSHFFVECPKPNPDVYKFDGRICFGKPSAASTHGHARQGGYRRMQSVSSSRRSTVDMGINIDTFGAGGLSSQGTSRAYQESVYSSAALDPSNVILQGTILKNTTFAFALVAYTGHETKLAMNKQSSEPIKYARVDQMINKVSSVIFCCQLAIAMLMGIVGNIWESQKENENRFIYFDSDNSGFFQYFVIPLRFLLLMSFMIPISLKVTLDIAKYFYASALKWDLFIYDHDTETPADALNTDIIEDMGQIDFVLTDKTGTLTDNVMVLKKCSINGKIFGGSAEADSVFNDGKICSLFMGQGDDVNGFCSPYIEFARALALCHNVNVKGSSGESIRRTGPSNMFKGISPDEIALVAGMSKLGVSFVSRSPDNILTLSLGDTEEKYELIHLLDFSSDRKRASVIVKVLTGPKKGEYRMYMKGADEVVFPRCNAPKGSADDFTSLMETCSDHLEKFASWGLRTLVVAFKVLQEEEVNAWLKELKVAKESLESREQLVELCYSQFETGLSVLGVSAIEDKLQEGVPEALSVLKQSNIKLCMLTGDKYTTAVEIAKSCNLITPEASGGCLLTVSGETYVEVGSCLNFLIEQAEEKKNQCGGSRTPTIPLSVVLPGSVLNTVLKLFPLHFLKLCAMCESVICCRVTPAQKAAVVEILKEKRYCTLAIGDGGNDVAMIQAANVGVGIVGKEGLQAVRASDFCISRFYFLVRLMLIHGRWSYNRTSFIALYSFQKSIYICLMQVMFNFFAGFSGASFFDTLQLSTYNVVFTGIPIIFYVLDQDVQAKAVIQNPHLYKTSQKGTQFNKHIMIQWVIRAVFQSVVTLFTVLYFFGEDGSQQPAAVTAYSIAICVQMLNLLIESHYITALNFLIIIGQVCVMWLLFTAVSFIPNQPLYGYFFVAVQKPQFFLAHFCAIALCFLPVMGVKLFNNLYNPAPELYVKVMHERPSFNDSEELIGHQEQRFLRSYSEMSASDQSVGSVSSEQARLVSRSRNSLFA